MKYALTLSRLAEQPINYRRMNRMYMVRKISIKEDKIYFVSGVIVA